MWMVTNIVLQPYIACISFLILCASINVIQLLQLITIVPRKYVEKNNSPEADLIQVEWEETCDMALHFLCCLLQNANTLRELVQFMSNHDIHPGFENIAPLHLYLYGW